MITFSELTYAIFWTAKFEYNLAWFFFGRKWPALTWDIVNNAQ